MTGDLRSLLEDWPYDPRADLMVRRITGPHGESRLQIRLELGLLELHPEGRPDGQQPGGFASLLDFHLDRLRRGLEDGESLRLTHAECLELQREAMQYYHRRLVRFKLGEWREAVADADHNLAIMDLLRDHAEQPTDWLASEQYRSFVLGHRTRAEMLQALAEGRADRALRCLEEGIATIETLFRTEYERPDLLEQSTELHSLRQLRRSLLEDDLPLGEFGESEERRLERELTGAILREEFERAARLRDALDQLRRTGGRQV